MAKRFYLENCELTAPVTALEFVNALLLIGEGPYLSIYNTTSGKRIVIKRVFDNQRVHCIQVCDSSNFITVAVCGGKAASVLHLNQFENTSELYLVRHGLFSDWIWDLCFFNASSVSDSLQLGLVTGHNTVCLWDIGKDEKMKIAQCEEQCILYCARFIGRSLETMWLACGTVFNEVLLWKVQDKKNKNGTVAVRKRLCGHDGVIFSITYNEARKIICSVSDDRSVKVWKLVFNDLSTTVEVSTEPLLTLYGHKARVWDCLILPHYIVTIGEDSLCLVWNSSGEIIKEFTGHIGKSIWSLAVGNGNQIISTGGGDGSVRLWSLNDHIQMTQDVYSDIPDNQVALQPSRPDIPRCLGFLPNNNVLVLTDKGNFYQYKCFQEDCKTETWEFLRNEPEFCCYSVMALSPCCNVVGLGNIHGDLKIFSSLDKSRCPLQIKPYNDKSRCPLQMKPYNDKSRCPLQMKPYNDKSRCPLQMKPYNGKILSLHWTKDGDDSNRLNLFACGPYGKMIWWAISDVYEKKVFSCEVKSYFCLPLCRQRWPNSVFVLSKNATVWSDVQDEEDANIPLVLCGDRRGSLHVFKGCDILKPLNPIHSYLGIHGLNGLTHISCNSGFIYTTGRDGYFRQFKLQDTNLQLVDKRKVFKGLEWIEQLNFTSDGDLLVLGFHTVDFVIWSTKRSEILHRIPCGGGHRVWDIFYKKCSTKTTAMFTYLKKKTVHVHKLPQKDILHTSILQESFHGREATCVRFITRLQTTSRGDVVLMATGSEDTDINIMGYTAEKNQKRFTKVFKCQGHISSVRCLSLAKVKSSCDDLLMFSCGGRASLKCWSINLSNVSSNEDILNPRESSHPLCTLLTELPNQVSRYKRKRLQRQIMEGSSCDVRFMSFSVFSLSELLNFDCSIFGIVAGCSDGLLRLYAMDSKIKIFELICENVWHDKCLLTVGHFIYTSDQPHLIAYTADTAGKIAFWDFTKVFLDHFSRNIENNDEEMAAAGTECPEKESFHTKGMILKEDKQFIEDEELGKNFQGLKVCSNFDVTEERLDIGKVSKEIEEKFLTIPFYENKLHQSGVNCISLLRIENGHYMLCSGGDDGAISVVLFQIDETNTTINMNMWCLVSVPDAHISSTTGMAMKWYGCARASTVLRAGYYHFIAIPKNNSEMVVTMVKSHRIDVADVQDVDVEKDQDDVYHIIVCGVGLQMITLKSEII